MAQSLLGNIKNKHAALDVSVGDVAAAVNLTKGMAVYQDGALGFKPVPTASQPSASQIRFMEVQQDNTNGVLGDKKAETYKSGTIMVVLAQGNIPIRSKLRASTTTAGSLSALADPGDATTPTAGEVDAARDVSILHVADYLGHPDEVGATGKEVTAATDGQEILVHIK